MSQSSHAIDPEEKGADHFTDGPEYPRVGVTNGCIERVEKEVFATPFTMADILSRIGAMTGRWPRRVGPCLFVHEKPQRIDWLPNEKALFGYLGHKTGIPPTFHKRAEFHTRGEVFAELQRTAIEYDCVEEFPHVPPYATHYYTCHTPALGDGRTLQAFLDRFCPATPIDRDLILALVGTLFWGGPAGARPAFVITADEGRGCGKTQLMTLCSQMVGGCVALEHGEDIGGFKSRLLSPEGMRLRVAAVDNVKTSRFSWAELEALITATTISGKRLYSGEGRRPNTLTYILTLNGPSMSQDLAQRSVIIKLVRPTYSASWLEDTQRFVEQKRQALIADVVAFLNSEPMLLRQYTRWQSWEQEILSRLPEPHEAQKVIAERQGDVDAESEESTLVEQYVAAKLTEVGIHPDRDRVFLPSELAVRWMADALGEKLTTVGGSRKLRQMIREHSVTSIQEDGHHGRARGFVWEPAESDPSVPPIGDIKARFSKAF